MDKLRSMEVFVAAVEAGSFAAAAERCGMSAVMVGKHIRALEQMLGAALLTRTTRRQALTEIGRRYADQCRAIRAQIDEAQSLAESMRTAPRGLLKVTAPVSFGARWLAPAVTDYLRLHPDVTVDLNLNDRTVDLVEEGFDVAVRIGPLPDSTLVARPLRPYGMAICASPAYLKKHGRPRTPADLAQHECLEFTGWLPQARWKLKGERDGRLVRPGRFCANSTAALRMAALNGFGIVMQAEVILADDIAAGRLVPLLRNYLPSPRPMHLVYSRDRRATPKLTTFVDFLLERFGQ
ncbi:DNA-binding transcriptional LysR family regulator [Pseudoduganella flava]|uniref:DNA-binding transcriptional LysR family regulator n=1 Tax=Pseudoduganella flava TaxID=871742 RepID=A0A562PS93_9BURK|nr:LysR family transcriptional regulator [Pseudoduganella flava]QGZ39372.1 LysR family transcriptional regulator [Pseudoduganella flava]TWI47314.1 DNA-binding transcriptional LysR family regulator [Pseudoduganella flava]